jgi:hypothetical protein
MHQLGIVGFLLWPGVVVGCGLLNMLITWTFSWSELIFDLLIGMVAGVFLFLGTRPSPHPAVSFFFVFSQGFFGILWVGAHWFRDAFSSPDHFIVMMAVMRLGATVWCAAWDRLSVSIGADLSVGGVFFSLLLFPAKWPFGFITGGVGFLIWIVGLIYAIASSGAASFAGGCFVSQFDPNRAGDDYSTTFGWCIHSWYGKTSFRHELYHTRQHIYMGDWLMPFWVLGCLWGAISGAIKAAVDHTSFDAHLVIGATKGDIHAGNPIEVAAYQL